MTGARLAMVLGLLGACGKCGDPPPPPQVAPPRDATPAPRPDAPHDLAPLALGRPSADAFAYVTRGGQPAYRDARAAEAHGDWPGVAAACRRALAMDPGHLAASYLLAVALAKTGRLDQVLAPLQVAVGGDFAKWAAASLAQPALQPFLATPTGRAWRRRVAADRAAFVAAVQRGVLVRAGGDLYAVDVAAPRWYRLTHAGDVVAGLAVLRTYPAHTVGYVARRRGELAVGAVDLDAGREVRGIALPGASHVAIGYRVADPAGWIVRAAGRPQRLGLDGRLGPAAPGADALAYLAYDRELVVDRDRAFVRAPLPARQVSADWDEHQLASAMRLGASNVVLTAPGGTVIDGDSLRVAPDLAHLAYVAIPDHCDPATAATVSAQAFVADTTTGAVRPLATGLDGLGLEWIADGTLAIAGDGAVSIVQLSGGAPITLAGATDLAVPHRPSPCAPAAAEPPSHDDTAEDVPEPAPPPDAGAPR